MVAGMVEQHSTWLIKQHTKDVLLKQRKVTLYLMIKGRPMMMQIKL